MMIGTESYDERDREYVPPGTQTLKPPTKETRDTPSKVVQGVVTTSLYDKERIISGTPSGSASGSGGASGFEEASISESPTLQG